MASTRTLAALAAAGTLATVSVARADAVAATHSLSIYEGGTLALKSPEGVACAEGTKLVIADTGNGRVLTYSVQEGAAAAVVSEVRIPQLVHPVRVEMDGSGDVLVLDRKARRIGRLGTGGAFKGFVEIKADHTVHPASFRVGPGGDLFVLDVAGPAVLVVDGSGAVKRTLPLPSATFTDLLVDPAGAVFVLDPVAGVILTAGKDAKAFQPFSSTLRDTMSFPANLAQGRGRLFVVDQNGHGLAVVGADGRYQGRALTMGWADGALYYPAQLCFLGDALAVIADRGNNRVQVFRTTR